MSAQTFETLKPEESTQNQPKLEDTVSKDVIPEKTGVKTGTQENSEADSEIATSLNSMRLEMKTTLGEINSTVKLVAQANASGSKQPVEEKEKDTGFIDLSQPPGHHATGQDRRNHSVVVTELISSITKPEQEKQLVRQGNSKTLVIQILNL